MGDVNGGVKRKQRNGTQHYRGEGRHAGHVSEVWEGGSNKPTQKGSQNERQRGKAKETEI